MAYRIPVHGLGWGGSLVEQRARHFGRNVVHREAAAAAGHQACRNTQHYIRRQVVGDTADAVADHLVVVGIVDAVHQEEGDTAGAAHPVVVCIAGRLLEKEDIDGAVLAQGHHSSVEEERRSFAVVADNRHFHAAQVLVGRTLDCEATGHGAVAHTSCFLLGTDGPRTEELRD